ncbi:class F sortase [Streptomyces sp. NPDC008313]|uniref:class F sortase n=1 Tax=Streptomyces sp. NPDC008313 TaxID=3364826 RepID=UPI0036E0FD0C
MAPRRRRRRPWRRTRAYRLARTFVLAIVLVAVGVRIAHNDAPVHPAVAGHGAPAPDRPGADARGGAPAPAHGAAPARPAPGPPPRPLPRSRATVLRIPHLGIKAPVVVIGLGRDRQLATPPVDKPRLVGWYKDGPAPGEKGTAIVVGHRDTRTGPAVFAALGQLPPGRPVEVRRADGRTAVYTVDAVRTYDKAHFPDKEVYGPSDRPELRLITCGGAYDRKTGYASNVVVFAHLTATREPGRPAHGG